MSDADPLLQGHESLQSSSGSYGNASAIMMRLDTARTLYEFRVFLSGSELVPMPDGSVKEFQTGVPLANKRGIQMIMCRLTSAFNPHVVQGNLDEEEYTNHLKRVHQDLVTDILTNLVEWSISENDVSPIMNQVMTMYVPFLSRPKFNKERESYAETIRTSEVNNYAQQRKKFLGVV